MVKYDREASAYEILKLLAEFIPILFVVIIFIGPLGINAINNLNNATISGSLKNGVIEINQSQLPTSSHFATKVANYHLASQILLALALFILYIFLLALYKMKNKIVHIVIKLVFPFLVLFEFLISFGIISFYYGYIPNADITNPFFAVGQCLLTTISYNITNLPYCVNTFTSSLEPVPYSFYWTQSMIISWISAFLVFGLVIYLAFLLWIPEKHRIKDNKKP